MLPHHLLASFRNLRKRRVYTLINLAGLAIGLASCLLIANYLFFELSFDRFHPGSENIYRINTTYTDNSGTAVSMVNSPPALVPGIAGAFPEIVRTTRLRYAMRSILEQGEVRFYENKGFYADSLFLETFAFPLAAGDRNTALDQPNSVVLTREIATKYFGDGDAMGQIVTMNNEIALTVTGILESIPSNSHLQFDFLVSFSTYVVPEGYFSDLTSWSWLGFLSYVQLNEGADARQLQTKLDRVYQELNPEDLHPYKARVQSLQDIYLGSSDLVDDLASGIRSGNRDTVYVFGIVALLILVIAGFNYTNLSIAVSVSRNKELGVRRILGASGARLVAHMLTESVVLSVAGLVIAYVMSIAAFPYINEVLGWGATIDRTQVIQSVPYGLTIAILLGVVAGLLPWWMLTGRKSTLAIQRSATSGARSGTHLRKILIAVQFGISISLVAATLVINKQIKFMSEQELGFESENVVVIKLLREDMALHYEPFRNRLLPSSHVVSITQSQRPIGDPWPVNEILVDGRDPSDSKQVQGNLVGFDYVETMGIKLKEGRTFSREFPNDPTRSIIVSENTVDYLSLEDPVGKEVHYFALDGPRTIVGVVEDFNFLSLHHEVLPMVLIMPFVDLEYVFVRLSPGPIAEKVDALRAAWEATVPGTPLEFNFLDDELNQLYQQEQRLSYMISGFSGLALLLAFLGLYGLIAFSVAGRQKEIGIRKVLGASIPSVLILLSRQYLVLIAVASVIAIPAIRHVLTLWLEGYAYKTEIELWIYGISVISLFAVSLVALSHRAISAALENPVNVLKDE